MVWAHFIAVRGVMFGAYNLIGGQWLPKSRFIVAIPNHKYHHGNFGGNRVHSQLSVVCARCRQCTAKVTPINELTNLMGGNNNAKYVSGVSCLMEEMPRVEQIYGGREFHTSECKV
jgi:hypothetical protein